jgi:DNA-binding transcriptional ArsR family regulator
MNLDAAFFALADPTRRAILARLAQGDETVMELAEPFEMSQPAISKHLKVLEGAGLIDRRVEGNRRPCRLRTETVREIEDWLSSQRAVWEGRLDRMEAYINQMNLRGPKHGEPKRKK